MFSNFTVDWKESLIILLGLVVIVLLFYVFNRKSIAREKEARELLKQRMEHDRFHATQAQPIVENRKATSQIVQAYERFIILMERIDLQKLVTRVAPISDLKQDYASFLIQNIEQEHDFNISQQLYISEEAWALIATAKQTIIQQILKTSLKEDVVNATDLQQKLLQLKEANSVTEIAKNRLKQEFKTLV
ncbi:hypothetical protein H1R17_11415 [Flavobacterium sp. xlx-214]|uniref:DUF7935 family protein n=1 Tax=unclassified Flavobacterium TaxID=196869 RepID=UPI0013D45145|nr:MULTISPECIES: hypothetical protein [unclassified Flavobacterium]MBA5791824.1 hypothetical protein [Flavobacterium sp. xlx-221]QMI83061.1 hypothetical protein H1R17_11415 [Flavobacterium sp. xlx-214]